MTPRDHIFTRHAILCDRLKALQPVNASQRLNWEDCTRGCSPLGMACDSHEFLDEGAVNCSAGFVSRGFSAAWKLSLNLPSEV